MMPRATPCRTLFAAAMGFLLAAGAAVPAPASPLLRGTLLAVPMPAPDFVLTDQHGRPFRMVQTRGKVAVLSFLYTHCTDFCPFLALKLKETVGLLGPEAGGLVAVAVTTDPRRDTPAVLADYSRAIGMYDSWHFVTGSADQVGRLWRQYAISVETGSAADLGRDQPGGPPAVQPAAQEESDQVARGLTRADRERAAGELIERFGGGYEVSHDTPFWIVDKRGFLRAWLGADAAPADIAFDVKALLAE